MQKPSLGFWGIWNISFGFFGIQIAFGLQNANMSRIFQTLGVSMEDLAVLWLAGPITGLLVQPLVGHFSDRTWGPLGRRRPYFLAGAIFTTIALVAMPNAPVLWVAAALLWILDASINISMEPFRAFVGDMLPSRQRTRGFAMQTIFIGVGATLASFAPQILTELGVPNTAPEGVIPDTVKYSFYIGATALFLAILWTVVTSREYSPEQLRSFTDEGGEFSSPPRAEDLTPAPPAAFTRAGVGFALAGAIATGAVFHFDLAPALYVLTGGVLLAGAAFLLHAMLQRARNTDHVFSHILNDLSTMPQVMRRLAVVQFFSWFALFIMWVYATPAITSHHFGTSDPTTAAYGEGANLVGVIFGWYNMIAAAWAFALPLVAKALGKRGAHALSLIAGAAGFGWIVLAPDPAYLPLATIGIGMAWGSILAMPYAILTDALPAEKMGVYMGIFNFFIVIPQIVVGGLMGVVLSGLLGGQSILLFVVAAGAFALAAAATSLVRTRAA
jgi:maltose/moltooligosaccharide transporter